MKHRITFISPVFPKQIRIHVDKDAFFASVEIRDGEDCCLIADDDINEISE